MNSIRLHLICGFITFGLLWMTFHHRRHPVFGFEDLAQVAEHQIPFYSSSYPELPPFLKNLDYDQTRDIRWKNNLLLWPSPAIPFQARFFHRTGKQSQRIDIYSLHGSQIDHVLYSPSQFDFGKNKIPVENIPADLGYSGFRLHYPLNRKDYLDEFLVFLGGSYFRSLGKNQHYGLSARALAINPGLSDTAEEFPSFTRFWIREPERTSDSIQILALLESPSATGAYEFVTSPGDETKIEVHAKIFVHQKIKRLAIAPISSMYWFGENSRMQINDFRPEVHDSDGLLIQNGKEEWLWRPLSNSPNAQENSFQDQNLHGFGLLQRDRDFQNYQDLEAHYHERPSLWIQPKGNWNAGAVQLIQWPTKNEYQDNILACWMLTSVEPKTVLDIRYTMYWFGDHEHRPPLGRCTQTRIHYPVGAEPPLFVVDFSNHGLENIPSDHPPQVEVTANIENIVQKTLLQPNQPGQGWRVTFEIDPTKIEGKPVELRCCLRDEHKPLTETWTYTWSPPRSSK
ncbi:MAG: glucan biosynthesis protein [Verrucomicrobiota bacterium]